mgnify:CR=1 FL=1
MTWPFRRRRRPADEVSCRQLVELLTDYLDGVLPTERHDAVDRHLAACAHCREYLEQFRTTVSLTRRLAVEDVPPETMDALLDAFRDWRG